MIAEVIAAADARHDTPISLHAEDHHNAAFGGVFPKIVGFPLMGDFRIEPEDKSGTLLTEIATYCRHQGPTDSNMKRPREPVLYALLLLEP